MTKDDAIDALAEQCERLVLQLEELCERSGTRVDWLTKRAATNRRLIYLTMVGISLDVLLTIGLIVIGQNVSANAREIANVQERTSTDVLCPLYAQFLTASKAPPPPYYTPQQVADRAKGFKVIEEGYRILNCENAASSH
ncbi:hypothetical protein OV450_3439 [Actinobacteria bacterium OV450]|nr:hypothetical protein OV450_3439 [Actinobacteria bacterium OV450]